MSNEAKQDAEETTPETATDTTAEEPVAASSEPAADSLDVGPTSELSAAITALQQEKQQTWDRLLRTAAEFENYKKRSRRDLGDAKQRAEDRVVLDFLPVIDNLERALAHVGDQEADGGLVDGVKMVHKQFLATLERFDIRPFDSVDQLFDPEQHEAIQQLASDKAPNTVIHELQRGYRRGDRLVRPALVVVSSGQAEQPAEGGEPPGAVAEEGAGKEDGSTKGPGGGSG